MSAGNPRQRTHDSARDSNMIVHALIGGLAGLFLSFIPFSSVLGGGIASYLEGGTTTDGLKVGALAGIVMLVPLILFFFVAIFFLGFAGVPAGPELVILLFVFVGGGGLYTVGLSAAGGYIGIYVRDDI